MIEEPKITKCPDGFAWGYGDRNGTQYDSLDPEIKQFNRGFLPFTIDSEYEHNEVRSGLSHKDKFTAAAAVNYWKWGSK